jgi:hypothetical protein
MPSEGACGGQGLVLAPEQQLSSSQSTINSVTLKRRISSSEERRSDALPSGEALPDVVYPSNPLAQMYHQKRRLFINQRDFN